jgi:hypothetical protein
MPRENVIARRVYFHTDGTPCKLNACPWLVQIIDALELVQSVPKADRFTLLLFEPTRQTAGTISPPQSENSDSTI